jgi:DNA-binding NarL/FixJ family response regulator
MTIRTVIADDHTIVREGLRSVLEKEIDIEIVAEATDGRAVLELAEKLKPDVIVLDIAMPIMSGIEATRKICNKYDNVKVVILSMHSDKRFVSRALKAGAQGYMLKDCAAEELIRAIRAVVANQTYLSPAVASGVVKGYLNYLSMTSSEPLSTLTPRENEILQLIAEGKNTKDIALILNLSIKTVETHRQRIMIKLNIYSIAGLTKYAVSEGLASLEI